MRKVLGLKILCRYQEMYLFKTIDYKLLELLCRFCIFRVFTRKPRPSTTRVISSWPLFFTTEVTSFDRSFRSSDWEYRKHRKPSIILLEVVYYISIACFHHSEKNQILQLKAAQSKIFLKNVYKICQRRKKILLTFNSVILIPTNDYMHVVTFYFYFFASPR